MAFVREFVMSRCLEVHRYILFFVFLGIFFGVASIFNPEEVVVGNDSTLLYQVDSIAYGKNLALTPINSPVHPQHTSANYFLLPLVIYSSFQNFIAASFSLSTTGVRLGLNITLSIVGAYLLYSLMLGYSGIDKKDAILPATLGAFSYGLHPIALGNLLTPIYNLDAFFVYPVTLFLVIRYVKAENPLLWLGITVIFINTFLYVFSLSTAPFLVSFISIALFLILFFARDQPRACALRILILFTLTLLSSAYYWIPQALVFDDVFGAVLTESGNLARLVNPDLIKLNTLTAGFSGIPSGQRLATISLRGAELNSWDLVLRFLFLSILVVSIVLVIVKRNDIDQSAVTQESDFYCFSLFALSLYLIYIGLWAPSGQVLEYLHSCITHLKGGSMFRDPNKWVVPFAIAYGTVVSIAAVNIIYASKTWIGRVVSLLFFLSLSVLFFKSAVPLLDKDFQSAGFGSRVSPVVDGQKFRTEMKDFDNLAKQGGGLLWVPLSESSFGVTPSGTDGSYYVGDGAAGILSGITTYYGYANLWRGYDKVITPLENENTPVLMRELHKYNIKYIAFPKLDGYVRQTAFPYQTEAEARSQIEKWRTFVGRCGAPRIINTARVDVYDLDKCTDSVVDDYARRCVVLGDKGLVVLSLLLRGSLGRSFSHDDLGNMIVLPVRYSSGWISFSGTNESNLVNFLRLLLPDLSNYENIPIFNYDSNLSLGCQKVPGCIGSLKNLYFSSKGELKVLLIHKVHLAFMFGIFISTLTFFFIFISCIKSFWLGTSVSSKQVSLN